MRLDLALVARGLTRSRNRAASLVADGRVSVNGKVATKASLNVSESDDISLETAEDTAYASRASFKLLRTLEALQGHLDVAGREALDVGASTGGFTDVLLRRGAANVVALDVGHDQLLPELKQDPRVIAIEGYNARELDRSDLPYSPDLVVCDVSFISITLILKPIVAVLAPQSDLLLMVKPQFEVGRDRIGSGGVVRDVGLHAQAIMRVVDEAATLGLELRAILPSALPGPNGNREFFVWLQSASEIERSAVQETPFAQHRNDTRRVVDQAVSMAADGDMIGEQASMLVTKGMPNPQAVPATKVYWA